MGHKQDYYEEIRRWTLPKLHSILERYGLYAESRTTFVQYVGTVPVDVEEFEETLHEMGLVRNYIASYKHLRWDTSKYEKGSWVKRYKKYRGWQLHVVLYGECDETHVFAHYERNYWRHPIKHYKGVGYNPVEGRRRMKQLLDKHGVEYEQSLDEL